MTNPEIIPAAEGMMDATYNSKIGLWMENFAVNLPKIRKGLDLLELPKQEGHPCIVVGGGPSLKRYRHLSMIKKSGWNHPILCCDKTLRDCLDHGITPYAVASVDGSPVIARFYKGVSKEVAKQINAVFAVTVHPRTVKTWKGAIYWFLALLDCPYTPDEKKPELVKTNRKSVSYIMHLLSRGKSPMSAIGNVGATLWNIGYELGCSPLILIGFDYSEQVRFKEQLIYWKSYVNMFNKVGGLPLEEAKQKAAVLHQVETNPDFGTTYLVNPIWKSYRRTFAQHIIQSKVHTLNCTGGGCLTTRAISVPHFEAYSLKKALAKFG